MNVKHLKEQLESLGCRATNFQTLSGGSINQVYKVDLSDGTSCVLKTNTKCPADFFEAEAHGLTMLKSHCRELVVPEVFGHHQIDNEFFLLMEYLDSGQETEEFQKNLGFGLARLHLETRTSVSGLDRNNFIGSLRQKNAEFANFYDFFARKRLFEPFQIATKKGFFNSGDQRALENIMRKLPEIIPDEDSSLLHGDLWSGNKLALSNGRAAIIDPAIYFGNREIDIAMTQLFGGFTNAFYSAYHELYPLVKGWKERVSLFNLYPLLVHTILFGGGYSGQVSRILRKFGN